MKTDEAEKVYKRIKAGPRKYKEELHCPLLLRVMGDENFGTFSQFCVKAEIGERTFYEWLDRHDTFLECYALGKMLSREAWEAEGRFLRDEIAPMGTISHRFDYWRMIGWTRFGIGKTSKVRLKLMPASNPNEQYQQLLKQAADGEFTAGELKQLMEAINVGLNAHQAFKLQEEINQLKKDLETMEANNSADNQVTTKRFTEKD